MWIDISRPIEEGMAVYKNRKNKQPRIEIQSCYHETGINESAIFLNLHTGTHMDAPYHRLPHGKTIDAVDPTLFIGPCRVIDLSALERRIEAEDLSPHHIQKGECILLRTRNSLEEEYSPSFICLLPSAADYLRHIGIRGVGIDAMSVERDDPAHPVHEILLNAGIGILEDIRLKNVKAGDWEIMAIPLRLSGRDASPCRALLFPPSTRTDLPLPEEAQEP